MLLAEQKDTFCGCEKRFVGAGPVKKPRKLNDARNKCVRRQKDRLIYKHKHSSF